MSIKEIANNKNARAVMSNFIYLTLLKGISFIFPLITLPYLAKVLGPDKFGAIAFATSIIVIIETITDWGFNYIATRDIAIKRDDLKYVSNIYCQVFYARILLMIISFIALWILIQIIPEFKSNEKLILFTFLYIPGNILFPQWLFQAFERMRYITILSILAKIVFTALIFVIITKSSDYVYEPVLNACSFLISGFIAQYIIFKKFKLILFRPKYRDILLKIKGSTNMFISLILPNLYTNFSVIILKTYCGDLATGIYNGGQKFQGIVEQLTQILSRAFFPFLARHKEKHYIYVMISGAIALAASIFMFVAAPWFVNVFLTEEFSDAIIVMRIFSITPIFLFLMNTYGTNYLVIVGKENILRNIVIIVSIIGFVLTWLLTPEYSYIGVASTITVVWGIRGLWTFIEAKKIQRSNG